MSLQQTAPAAKAEMLIRKPVQEVFEAMVNPDITSKFWFSKGSGRLEQGKMVEWVWEKFNFKIQVTPHKVEHNHLIAFDSQLAGVKTTAEITFIPHGNSATFVSITEKGWDTNDEQLIQKIVGQTEGWTLVLSALKAWLEHNIILKVVEDRYPEGLERERHAEELSH